MVIRPSALSTGVPSAAPVRALLAANPEHDYGGDGCPHDPEGVVTWMESKDEHRRVLCGEMRRQGN